MENFERVANEIVAYVNSSDCRMREIITMHGARFIVCGASGSGKTRAIEFANKQLVQSQQIADSGDLLFCKSVSEADKIVFDKDLDYQGARHIGFSGVRREFAANMQSAFLKVFWLSSQQQKGTEEVEERG